MSPGKTIHRRITGWASSAPPDGLVPEADGATYEAMLRHNVPTIVAALRQPVCLSRPPP